MRADAGDQREERLARRLLLPAAPFMIAHRGASARAPESTRAAIRAAIRSGAHMVELDVQMTRDERLVIFHDDRLERTTDGRGRLTQMRYEQLARLDAGRWFHSRFAGERILLVSQAVRLIPSRKGVILELKRTMRRRVLLRHLAQLVTQLSIRRRLLVSSFDPLLLAPLRRYRIASALLCHRKPDQSLRRAIRLGCLAWHPHVTLVSPRRIRAAHAAGLRVHTWTVDQLQQAQRVIRWGVDGIFTNDPTRLRQAFRHTRPRVP